MEKNVFKILAPDQFNGGVISVAKNPNPNYKSASGNVKAGNTKW
jgi:hypothetical protein